MRLNMKQLSLILFLFFGFQGITEGQDRKEIANHMINKVIIGRSCDKAVTFENIRGQVVKVKFRGRVLQFICPSGSKRIGDKYSVCVDGEYSHPEPKCAHRGCRTIKESDYEPQGVTLETHVIDGSSDLVGFSYSCSSDHVLEGGSDLVYCDGRKWRGKVPKACVMIQDLSCDFGNVSTPHCNWTQASEEGVDWKRHVEETIIEGPGPDFDHTYGVVGKGHYMYVDPHDAPEGAIALMYSPWQKPEDNKCLDFWYHMNGNETNSTLAVMLEKKLGPSGMSIDPLWMKSENSGNQWNHAVVNLPVMKYRYRILFEATLNSKDGSDIAIDDVSIKSCDLVTTEQMLDRESLTVPPDAVTSEMLPESTVVVVTETTDDLKFYSVTSDQTNLPNDTATEGIAGVAPLTSKKKMTKSSKTPLVLGLVSGGVVFLICIVIGVFIIRKRGQRSTGNEDQDTRAFAYTSMSSDIPL